MRKLTYFADEIFIDMAKLPTRLSRSDKFECVNLPDQPDQGERTQLWHRSSHDGSKDLHARRLDNAGRSSVHLVALCGKG